MSYGPQFPPADVDPARELVLIGQAVHRLPRDLWAGLSAFDVLLIMSHVRAAGYECPVKLTRERPKYLLWKCGSAKRAGAWARKLRDRVHGLDAFDVPKLPVARISRG